MQEQQTPDNITPSPPQGPKLIEDALAVIGLAPRFRTKSAIEALTLMRGRFATLGRQYPSLEYFTRCFLLAADEGMRTGMTQGSPESRVQVGSDRAVNNFASWFVANVLAKTSIQELVDGPAVVLDVLAIHWLLSCVARHYGDQLESGGGLSLDDLEPPTSDIKHILRRVKTATGLNCIETGLEKSDFEQWVAAIDTLNRPPHRSKKKPNGAISSEHLIRVPEILEALHLVKGADGISSSESTAAKLPELSETQLWHVDWYYPRPAELAKLKEFINRRVSIDRAEVTVVNLIALSIFTCRDIDGVLSMPLVNEGAIASHLDHFEWTTETAANGKAFKTIVWRKAVHGVNGSVTTIHLPFRLSNWLQNLDTGVGQRSLAALVLKSEVPWSKRAYGELGLALGCSPKRAMLITRDLVVRQIYETTSNMALIEFWRSTQFTKIGGEHRVSLGHYLQVRGSRAITAFNAAIEAIFPKYELKDRNVLAVRLGTQPLSRDEVAAIAAAFARESEHRNPPGHHNHLALQTLFLAIATTGHRRSQTPFPFPWDFNLEERTIFIVDKINTGSEARFVPLSDFLTSCLTIYVGNLRTISSDLMFGVEVRSYAGYVAEMLGALDNRRGRRSAYDARPPSHGIFFFISEDGQRVERTIPTAAVDRFIFNATGIDHAVKRMRPTLAQHAWEFGCSGRSVQTLLGHQPELHSHGPASSWTIFEWMESVRPAIDAYIADSDILRALPSGNAGRLAAPRAVPEPVTSEYGYEGRARARAHASARADAAIKRMLTQHILEAEDVVITDQEFDRIERAVIDELADDAGTLRAVRQELAKQFQNLRNRRNLKISAAAVNRRRVVPGPIDIIHSRYLACAVEFRRSWQSEVGRSIGASKLDEIERLAQLAIALVCFDAVLAVEKLRALVEEVHSSGVIVIDGRVNLRGAVSTEISRFDISVWPGTISAALALGVSRDRTRALKTEEIWSLVEERSKVIIQKTRIFGLDKGISIGRLCRIFRPYWLLRQPGAMYSVAIGDHRGPAADARSELQLFGGESAISQARKTKPQPKPVTGSLTQNEAAKRLKDLFRRTRGKVESGTQRRRQQRARLHEILQSTEIREFSQAAAEIEIVSLLLNFIERLLVVGGPRVKTLAFSTIEKYFGAVASELIALAWDTDFGEIDGEALAALLEEASRRLNDRQADTVLRMFASHLRDTIGAPHCGPKWSNVRDPICVRDSLVLPRHTESAVQRGIQTGDAAGQDSALIIALCAGYGLRRNEAYGLGKSRFDAFDRRLVFVDWSAVSDRKTAAARRKISRPLYAGLVHGVVQKALESAESSPRQDGLLFEDLSGRGLINNVSASSGRAIAALRECSDNSLVVIHSLRHSFATYFTLAASARPELELSHQLSVRLLGTNYATVVREQLSPPTDWPFVPLAIGTVLGHKGVDQLLDTYFHASGVVIADHCARWQPVDALSDERMANMLAKERTTITKLRHSLAQNGGASPAASDDHVIKYYAGRNERRRKPATEVESQAPEVPVFRPVHEACYLARALLERLRDETSLAELTDQLVNRFSFPARRASQVIERYRALVLETGMDDFEPANSKIVSVLKTHARGVARGALEREKFLAQISARMERDPSYRDPWRQMLNLWAARVSPEDPRLVFFTLEEHAAAVRLIGALGDIADQLDVVLHGASFDRLLAEFRLAFPNAKIEMERASRGNHRAHVTEISMAVRQRAGSMIPDGRDLHRALLALYCVN